MTGVCLIAACPALFAGERITLKNGFDMLCDHREAAGDRVRLYMAAGDYVEVRADAIASTETVETAPAAGPASAAVASARSAENRPVLSPDEMREMLAASSARHNVDVDLLASVVRAESGGRVRAVSRAGAQGLMQLMPATAAGLGVEDSFAPEQNIDGGSAYLDSLLTRYHDNLALALAAYNAGPGAVDRWHGIPPYRETQLYVARVIREFNARVRRASAEVKRPTLSTASVQRKTANPAKHASNLSSGTQMAAAKRPEDATQRP
jgi:soluble lytic murein transglycosylase-like protein